MSCEYLRDILSANTELDRILRAYALGYVSITGPRLFGLLRILKRKDVTTEQKFQLVSRDASVLVHLCTPSYFLLLQLVVCSSHQCPIDLNLTPSNNLASECSYNLHPCQPLPYILRHNHRRRYTSTTHCHIISGQTEENILPQQQYRTI